MTHSELLALLRYDPETGVFIWLEKRKGRRPGKPAGGLNGSGHRSIQIGIQRFYAHRLAWFYAHGEWPVVVDHINGEPDDNRLVNLRSVDQRVNMQNQRGPRSNNKVGLLGVSWHKQQRRYTARITFDGKHRHLGLFDTPEEAHAAYVTAKRAHHEGCSI